MGVMKRALGTAAATGLVVTAAVGTLPAQAAPPPVECGQLVTSSITLRADLVCNGTDGLVVMGGSGISINLGGKTIRSTAWDAAHGVATAQVAGVRVVNSTGVTVTNGTIRNFAAGVAVHGGERNTFTFLAVEDNVGPAATADLGDGIGLFDSKHNVVNKNRATGNGPFGGISVVGDSDYNQITNNVSNNNSRWELCPEFDRESGASGCDFNNDGTPERAPYEPAWGQDMGIRIEGPGSNFNAVVNNTTNGNGSSGLFVTSTCVNSPGGPPAPGVPCEGPQNTDNEIRGNITHGNGFLRYQEPRFRSAPGSGIHLFNVTSATNSMVPNIRTTIVNNDVRRNARNGISIEFNSTDNVIRANTAVNNAQVPEFNAQGALNPAWDGRDANPGCDNNQWLRNSLGTFNQPCVGASAGKGGQSAATAEATESVPEGKSFQRRAR